MKKKLLCLSAILAMTSTTMVSFANEVTNYISEDNKNEIVQPRAQYAVVNASNVNIRSNAGTSYKVVGQLPKGVTVITTYTKQKYANGMWWQEIQSKYGNGWVADKYLNHIGKIQTKTYYIVSLLFKRGELYFERK